MIAKTSHERYDCPQNTKRLNNIQKEKHTMQHTTITPSESESIGIAIKDIALLIHRLEMKQKSFVKRLIKIKEMHRVVLETLQDEDAWLIKTTPFLKTNPSAPISIDIETLEEIHLDIKLKQAALTSKMTELVLTSNLFDGLQQIINDTHTALAMLYKKIAAADSSDPLFKDHLDQYNEQLRKFRSHKTTSKTMSNCLTEMISSEQLIKQSCLYIIASLLTSEKSCLDLLAAQANTEKQTLSFVTTKSILFTGSKTRESPLKSKKVQFTIEGESKDENTDLQTIPESKMH